MKEKFKIDREKLEKIVNQYEIDIKGKNKKEKEKRERKNKRTIYRISY